VLRTVHPPIPELSLWDGSPRTFSSEPLVELPDPHGDHHQAANGKGADPDGEDGKKPQSWTDSPDLEIALDGGDHECDSRHTQSQEPCNSDEVPKAERTFVASGRDGRL